MLRSVDIDHPTASIRMIKVKLKQTTKEMTLTFTKELMLDWTTACHMCIIQAIEDVKELKCRISELSKFAVIFMLELCHAVSSYELIFASCVENLTTALLFNYCLAI